MAKQSGQRGRLLALYRLLWEETDEAHRLSAPALAERLRERGIPTERKSVYDGIETLRQQGAEVLYEPNGGYYLAERTFQLAELKLLVDAVQASKFITVKKSRELIRRLEGQASRYQAQALHRQVYVAGRARSINESVYYAIDAIHAAITENRQISFQYFDYNVAGEKVLRHDGRAYQVSPFLLLHSNDFYYLIAYDKRSRSLRHYRVDKMLRLEQKKALRQGAELLEDFDIGRYTDTHFSMFRAPQRDVTLRCENRFSSVMVDRFGEGVGMVPEDEGCFTLTVRVAVSEQFYGWLFGLGGGVTVAAPEDVRQEMKRCLQEQLARYEQA